MIEYEGEINGSQVKIQCDDIFEFMNTYEYIEQKTKHIENTLELFLKGFDYGRQDINFI